MDHQVVHGPQVGKHWFKEKQHLLKQIALISQLFREELLAYSHDKAVRASFSVAWKIARAKAPHTAGESLIKPAAVEIARIMCGDAVPKTLAMVPLSKDIIKRCIQELSHDVLQQTIASAKRSRKFSLQLDETTDIDNRYRQRCTVHGVCAIHRKVART